MTLAAPNVETVDELMPMGRYEWERLIRRAALPQTVKLLAFVLASYADPDGSRVRPGNDVLASVLDLSSRSVRRLMNELTDRYGLLQLVMRGGGRGGQGRTTVYRLTIPTDLLERVELLPPTERANPVSPDTQMSSHTNESGDTQTSGQSGQSSVDNSDSPDIKMASQSGESEATQVAPENDFQGPNMGVTRSLSGQPEPIDRPPCMADYHPKISTNHNDHPSTEVPAELTTAHADEDHDEIAVVVVEEIEPAPPPTRCEHGLVERYRSDGTPSCALCRRLSTVESVENIPANIPDVDHD